MNLFDVYPLFPIEPVKAQGSWLWDNQGVKYLDFYGGHAVISIGHNHPHFVERLTSQLHKISFYSNSVQNSLQIQLAEKLGQLSGCENYQLFLCNSGAEANENALKTASFATNRKKIIAFKKSFHGRTSGAVAATDNPSIVSPFNRDHQVTFLEFNEVSALDQIHNDVAAVIIECIQGVGGIRIAHPGFLEQLQLKCKHTGAMLILDEVQCGYGRTGKFFAHQFSSVKPDMITTAKGMGNGFPVGGLLLHPDIKPVKGMLGTTFGGNHLACAAALSVLEVIEKENLIANAEKQGKFIIEKLKATPLLNVRGQGLMIGFDLPEKNKNLRSDLLTKYRIFTGEAKPDTVRLLPSLAIGEEEISELFNALEKELKP